jgi:sigma-B regulation protein RsbU (phosphoserine phosphatase)
MVYFTMIYGVLETATGKGTLCQAGHPYPLICRRDGGIKMLGDGGLPVGLVPDAVYETVTFELRPGDRLLIYSDGITECFNAEHEQFGEQRLGACLSQSRTAPLRDSLDQIKQTLTAWHHPKQDGKGFSDDISLLAIERNAL